MFPVVHGPAVGADAGNFAELYLICVYPAVDIFACRRVYITVYTVFDGQFLWIVDIKRYKAVFSGF